MLLQLVSMLTQVMPEVSALSNATKGVTGAMLKPTTWLLFAVLSVAKWRSCAIICKILGSLALAEIEPIVDAPQVAALDIIATMLGTRIRRLFAGT